MGHDAAKYLLCMTTFEIHHHIGTMYVDFKPISFLFIVDHHYIAVINQ